MRRFIVPTLLSCGLAAAVVMPAASTAAAADDRASGSQSVVVVVEVPRPWYAPDFLIVRKMRDAVPNYRSIPGLRYKAFTLAKPSGDFGGIYLWRDRASADAWFNVAWYKRVRDERGVEAKVRMFQAAAVFERKEQAARAEREGDAVATLVSIPNTIDRAAWAAQSPQERAAPGLLRLYEILMPEGGVGRVYLWRDNAAAERWLDTAWRARMRTLTQRDARIEWFDAPILMPAASPAAKNAATAPAGTAR
jgi:hypothetical protein